MNGPRPENWSKMTLFERMSRLARQELAGDENSQKTGKNSFTPSAGVIESSVPEQPVSVPKEPNMNAIIAVPLHALHLSDLNVRQTERDADIESLAENIAANGLLSSLNVIPIDYRPDEYEVIGGGRRLQALQLLALRGLVPAGHPVAVQIAERDRAREISLSENMHRVAMNPADEFDAFKAIVDSLPAGNDADAIAKCAKRFGVTERYVRGRLRLAALSPMILEALRSDAIGLSSAIAYAAVDDHAAQERVFKEHSKPKAWQPHDPKRVRDELLQKTYSADCPEALYVGLDAYTAAGGRIDTDLFSTDATPRLLDPSIIDNLVAEKFEREAAKIAKKFKVTLVVLSKGYLAKVPEGWQRAPYSADLNEIIAAKQPAAINVVLDAKGKVTRPEGYALVVMVPKAPVSEDEGSDQGRPVKSEAEWAAERAAERKERHIKLEAIRLAVPKTAGTPFENRIFLPAALSWVNYQESEDGEELYVRVELRISQSEIDAVRSQAEEAYAVALAAQAEAKAREEAEAEERKAAAAKLAEKLSANPPAVVQLGGGTVFFRWVDGDYYDAREDTEEAEYVEESIYQGIAGVIDYCTNEGLALLSWPTIEAWEATLADAPQLETADA